jgi:hypothetical protein
MNCLIAHCPTLGCYMYVPVCTLKSETKPEFNPTTHIIVSCPSCGKEFRELTSLLEWSPVAEVTGKFRFGGK